MTEITQEGWKNKALSMLLAQLTSYVLFIAATVIIYSIKEKEE